MVTWAKWEAMKIERSRWIECILDVAQLDEGSVSGDM